MAPKEEERIVPANEKFALTTQLTYDERPLYADDFPKEGDMVLAINPEGRKNLYLTEKFAEGGEGVMYRTSIPGYVVKIYKKEKLNQDKFDKLKLMITHNIDHEGICFPLALIYNRHNQFVGYLMREARGESLQKAVFLPQLLKKKHPDWKKIDTVNLCLAILDKIQYLHERNIILGDINPANILVVSQQEVYFVDTDSYQIEGHPCPVGTINFTAPEIQKKEFSTFLRTMEQERFAVATLLFMIMLPGKPPYSHQGGEDQVDNILKGEFSYASGERSNGKAPEGMWRFIWSHLPKKLKDEFYETFRRGGEYYEPCNRLTDEYWIQRFKIYRKLLQNGTMAENDPMSLELFPDRLKKNPNANYIRCRICGKEVDENFTKEGICQECLDQGETYYCECCGKEMTYTNYQKYVKKAPRHQICYDCLQQKKEQKNEVFRRIRCSECGDYFDLTYGEKEFYDRKKLDYPKKCKRCRTNHAGSYRTPSNSSYSGRRPQTTGRPGSPSGCFITTAVCESFGKADNCYELSTLRSFRDDWLSQSPGGEELIEKYYQIAPKIVEEIDRRDDRKEIYLNIYERYLKPCLQFIENQQYEACRDLYRNMVLSLEHQHLSCSC